MRRALVHSDLEEALDTAILQPLVDAADAVALLSQALDELLRPTTRCSECLFVNFNFAYVARSEKPRETELSKEWLAEHLAVDT